MMGQDRTNNRDDRRGKDSREGQQEEQEGQFQMWDTCSFPTMWVSRSSLKLAYENYVADEQLWKGK